MDASIIFTIQQYLHNPVTDAVFPFVTALGEAGFIWIVIGLALLISPKTRWGGVLMLVSLAVTYLLGEVLIKPLVGRLRPFQDFPGVSLLIPPPSGCSFPSGHSGSSFTAAFSIWTMNKRAGAAAFVLAACIAFSRVFLFVHYPSDILAGALLGLLCAWAVHKIARCLKMRKQAG